jgi:hypothetical protein
LRLCLSPAASQHCCLSISYSECLSWSVWEGLHHLRGRGWGWFDGDRLRGRRLKVEELRLKDCVYPAYWKKCQMKARIYSKHFLWPILLSTSTGGTKKLT